jgi:hypothetical protein
VDGADVTAPGTKVFPEDTALTSAIYTTCTVEAGWVVTASEKQQFQLFIGFACT